MADAQLKEERRGAWIAFRERAESLWNTAPGLVILLLAGAGVRVLVSLLVGPIRSGYVYTNDSTEYLKAAYGHLFTVADRPAGYAVFLRALATLTKSYWLVVVVQHLLGLLIGVILYLAMRRVGASRWLSLVPSSIVFLDGYELFLEHAVLSETLFSTALALAVFAYIATLREGSVRWSVAAGVLVAMSALVRPVTLPFVAAGAVWTAAASPRPWSGRLVAGAASLLAGVALLFGYALVRNSATGSTGLGPTLTSGWHLYARVAEFADCRAFRPPPGTAALCEQTPPSQRLSIFHYYYQPDSPAVRRFGGPPHGDKFLSAFASAAIRGQPGDYLRVIAVDVGRIVAPSALANPRVQETTGPEAIQFGWPASQVKPPPSSIGALRVYQEVFYFNSLFIVAALCSALVGLFYARRQVRAALVLFGGVGVGIPLLSVATGHWVARYGVPAWPYLGAAGALGAWESQRTD